MENKIISYEELSKRPEFECIKEIGNRVEEKDLKQNNKKFEYRLWLNEDGNYETGWIVKTYYFDIWYAFDLLGWVRQNKI